MHQCCIFCFGFFGKSLRSAGKAQCKYFNEPCGVQAIVRQLLDLHVLATGLKLYTPLVWRQMKTLHPHTQKSQNCYTEKGFWLWLEKQACEWVLSNPVYRSKLTWNHVTMLVEGSWLWGAARQIHGEYAHQRLPATKIKKKSTLRDRKSLSGPCFWTSSATGWPLCATGYLTRWGPMGTSIEHTTPFWNKPVEQKKCSPL